MPRVLIVEDDPKIVDAVEKTLSLAPAPGFVLEAVSDPNRALPAAIQLKPDLILLDVRLPGGDGRVVLKSLKQNAATRAIPVIFLTGMSSEGDKVLGLNLGADDYVVKPFGAMELLARVQAVLRRFRAEGPSEKAKAPGGLAANPGRPLSRTFLIENSSSYGLPISTRSLDTHIKNLRKKLGSHARLIETVPKIGYRLASDHA